MGSTTGDDWAQRRRLVGRDCDIVPRLGAFSAARLGEEYKDRRGSFRVTPRADAGGGGGWGEEVKSVQ